MTAEEYIRFVTWAGPLLFILLMAGFIYIVRAIEKRSRKAMTLRPGAVAMLYDIAMPQNTKWQPDRAASFMEHITRQTGGIIAMRIVADKNGVRWQLVDFLAKAPMPEYIIKAVRTIYPEAEVAAMPYQDSGETTLPFSRIVVPFVLGNKEAGWIAPTKFVQDCKPIDPLAAVVQAMADGIDEGCRIILTIAGSSSTNDYVRQQGKEKLQQHHGSLGRDLTAIGLSAITGTVIPMPGQTTTDAFRPEDQKVAQVKPTQEQLWDVFILAQLDWITTPSGSNFDNANTALMTGSSSVYNHFTTGPGGRFQKNFYKIRTVNSAEVDKETSAIGIIRKMHADSNLKDSYKNILCPQEMATIFHLPHEAFKTPTIKWIASGRPSEAVLNNKEGVIIGKNGDNEIKISNEGDAKHTNIVGKTGTGKSTIMHATIHQNIKQGLGVCVVDPDGRIIRDILEQSIPDERIDDVVLLDLANSDYPPPLNPFNLADEKGQVGIGQIMAVLDKVYDLSTTTRAVDYIQLALNTIKFRDTPTVRDAVIVLRNPVERQKFLAKYGSKLDRASKEAWREFLAKESGQDSVLDPVVRRLRRFYQTDYVYAMLCHPDSLNWDQLMLDKKIILVSLGVDGQKVPEPEQQLLGALVVSQIELTARRAGRDHPLNFRLYIDEAQEFVTTSLPVMFEQIRKYGVWITIANQFLGQLKGRTLEATMGNVTNTFSFEVGIDDARELASYMKPTITADDLTALGKYRAAVKTVINGVSQPPFLVNTLPPPPPHPDGASRVEQIRKRSIQLWTPKTQAEVLAWLDERYPEEGFGIPKGSEPNKSDPDNEDFEVAG